MGIDGIGKKGPPVAPPQEIRGSARPSEAGRIFEVGKPAEPEISAAAVAAPRATPLDRLRSGEIDVGTYVDLKVEEATSHLTGIAPADLTAIRDALRDRVASDPMLVDLVRTAAGQVPQPRNDGS
jgi:hypothetical protein